MLERRAIWLLTLSVLMAPGTPLVRTTQAAMGGEVVSEFVPFVHSPNERQATPALPQVSKVAPVAR
jgi:hypothetical protein